MTRILMAQINTTFGDLRGNTNLILKALLSARANRCSLVMTPELSISGYPPNDLLHFSDFIEANEKALNEIVLASANLTLVVGCIRKNTGEGKPLFNSAAIIRNQKIIGYYDKCLLPTYDVFDERRYFEPGGGSQTFEHEGIKIALTICEDIWEEEIALYEFNPLDQLVSDHPDLLLNLSASPFEAQKIPLRLALAQKVALKLNCPVLYCNQVGGCDDLIFDGSSFACTSEGLLDQARSFQEDFFVVDTKRLPTSKNSKENSSKELYEALTVGIRDFFHKQHFKKALVGLSGGIDSALVTTLAAHALGPENVLAISMPSRFSSDSSIEDAFKLAQNLGIEIKKVPIESIHAPFLELLSPEFKGLPEDVTEENLQSRIRGVILMAFSNKLKHLVLSCGNKSEMAMGYATLYGDLAGGLGAISDLTKSQVYELSHWINREKEVIPTSILTKAPSAELKPNQKDSDTLPEYNLLDPIIEAYIEGHLSPEKIALKLKIEVDFARSIIQKIHRAEYKRRQAPLGLKVTSKAFSVGWNSPIVQKWA